MIDRPKRTPKPRNTLLFALPTRPKKASRRARNSKRTRTIAKPKKKEVRVR